MIIKNWIGQATDSQWNQVCILDYPHNGGHLWQKEITVSDLMRIVCGI